MRRRCPVLAFSARLTAGTFACLRVAAIISIQAETHCTDYYQAGGLDVCLLFSENRVCCHENEALQTEVSFSEHGRKEHAGHFELRMNV